MAEEVRKGIIPSHRIPKSVGFLVPGSGGWLPRVIEWLHVDADGTPFLLGGTSLSEWDSTCGNPYNNNSCGWIYKTPEGRMGIVTYFLSAEPSVKKWVFKRANQDQLIGRDALIPFDEYTEYSTEGKQLVFETPGGPPVVPKSVEKKAATGGTATYQSRF